VFRGGSAIEHAATLCPRGAENNTIIPMQLPEIVGLAGDLRRRAGDALAACVGGLDQDPIQWIERGVVEQGATIFEGAANVI